MNRRQLLKAGLITALTPVLAPLAKLMPRPLSPDVRRLLQAIEPAIEKALVPFCFDIVTPHYPIPRDVDGNACWISGRPPA